MAFFTPDTESIDEETFSFEEFSLEEEPMLLNESINDDEFEYSEEPVYRSLSLVSNSIAHPTSFEPLAFPVQPARSLAHLQAYTQPVAATQPKRHIESLSPPTSPPIFKRQKACAFEWEPHTDREAAWTYHSLSPELVTIQAQHAGANVDVQEVCQLFLDNRSNLAAPAYADYYQKWRNNIHAQLMVAC